MTKRKTALPQYLTVNQAGTYVFQARIPKHICQNNPRIRPTVWRSLGTKDRGEALRLSRRIWLMFDEITKHFTDPEVAAKATKLLMEYEEAKAKGMGFEYVESLDDTFEDGDFALFERALQVVRDGSSKVSGVIEENEDLKQQVEVMRYALLNHDSRSGNLTGLSKDDLGEVLSEAFAQAKQEDGPDFSGDNNLFLSDVIEEYMTFKIDNKLKPGSQKPYRTKLKLFESIVQADIGGERVRLSHITDSVMRKYADIMTKFPRDYGNQAAFKNKSIGYVVDYVITRSRSELEDEGIIISSDKKEHFRLVRALFKRIRKRKYPLNDDLESHLILEQGVESKKTKKKANLPYTKEELKLLFENDTYRLAKQSRKKTGGIDYWAPLIAVHTGATVSEICQLHFEDIKIVDGIDVIDINEDGWKTLKSEDGRPRLVPIHPNLKSLGFIEFVKKRKLKYDGKRIFPEAVRNKEEKYDAYSKRFIRFRKPCGIEVTNRTKTFHSFRSTVSTFLRENGCPEGIANDIIGHTSEQRSETYKTYAKNKTIVQITHEWIKKIDFGVDFDYPKRWRD